MIYDYDDVPPEGDSGSLERLPEPESEVVTAKTFLQQCSTLTGDNLYDHLTEVLNKILDERPENIIDFFEEYSRKIKEKRFKPSSDHLEDVYISPKQCNLSEKIIDLVKPLLSKDSKEIGVIDPEDEELVDMTKNDTLQLCYFFEQSGLGLPRSEMFALALSMRKLIKTEPIASIRFWGKILGLYKNYYVLEIELKEEEIIKRNELFTETEASETIHLGEQDYLNTELTSQVLVGELESEPGTVPRKLPPVPHPLQDRPPEPPQELDGEGVNKKVYYVCNEIQDTWIQLPNLTPLQIRVARQIQKSFTGFLNQEIITYPDFPGNEANYLRAQIARISAGTQISPLGYYTFKGEGGGEEEDEEEDAEGEETEGGNGKTNYKENRRYEAPPLNDLLDGSMSFWVHHTLYILPQGRTSWWNPRANEPMDEELGEEEGAENPDGDAAEPETGPALLTPLSEDASLEAVPPWSVRTSSNLLPEYALAIVRSNLWPGAYCFTTQGKLFQNIYIGYGHKYRSHNFTPLPLPFVEQDYPLGPEIMEITDPTGDQEEQWRIDHLPKLPPPGDEEEEGEGETEAEEEND